jgi:drug/metabolite transporter (DMT)-like permease
MSNDRLALSQAALLLAYAAGMAGGQLLFKAAANVYFLAAIVLYVALTVLWVWILTFTPLSRAYPFVALAFAITPLLAGFVFGEAVTARLMIGIGLILGGLLLVAG